MAKGWTVPYRPFDSEEYDAPTSRRFGPYVVLGELGTGGMGTVYRALDTRLERQVAVKVLHRETGVSGPRERFLREARLVSSLNHPNICTVFDIGDEDGDPYLVMELLEGESLKDRMLRGQVPSGDIREIAFRVGLALQVAHAKGIVHRDIKPANLFLVNNSRGSVDVKVLDFGLAKLEADNRRTSLDGLTRAGATVGTVEYMSPEQACGEMLDARSDLFSLGAVLYEMATGVVPFSGATSAIVFSELLNRDPIPAREKNLNLPRDLDRLIRSLLMKDRDRRLQSAGDVLKLLSEGSAEYEARRVDALRPARTVTSLPTVPMAASNLPVVKTTSEGRSTGAPSSVPSSMTSKPKLPSAPLAEPRVSVPVPALSQPEGVLDPQPAFGNGRLRGPSGVLSETQGTVRERPAQPHVASPDDVSLGWKVALASGVVVALLLTLLLILLLYRRPPASAALHRAPTIALHLLPHLRRAG